MNVRTLLESLAEPDFQAFMAKLTPNVPKEKMLGVRIPKLRKLAKEIAKGDWMAYLNSAKEDTFEEVMLQGLVIGYVKAELSEIFTLVEAFLPKIDNWAVCDSFCSSLKIAKKYPQKIWEFIVPYLKDTRPYYIRFGVVMLLDYYTDQEHVKEGLELLDQIRHEDYYVKMAVAWAVSIYYIKLPNETLAYLQQNNLDNFTYNKALQKITESFQVSKDTKQMIRSMKRK